MRNNDTYEAVRMMEKHGGGFVSRLAELWYVADAHNKMLLETTFKHYFDHYSAMAKASRNGA